MSLPFDEIEVSPRIEAKIFVCLWPIDVAAGQWRLVTAYPDERA